MKFRKASSLFLAGAMCLTTVGGAVSAFAEEESSSEAEEESVDYSTEDPITATITVWGPAEDQAEDYGQWLQERCEAFNEMHVNWDLTFEYGTCSEGDAGKTISQDPSGSADVYMYANDQIQTLIDAGALAELGGKTVEYIKDTNSEAIVDSVTVDDSVYGVPFTTNTWYMFYDKSVYDEDDIKSLDTMLEKGKVSFPLTNSWYISAFYVANGCTLFGEDGKDEEAGIDFSGEKGAAVTEYLVNMAANKNFVNDESGIGVSGMCDGTINAMFSGSWDYAKLEEAMGDNLGVAKLPTFTVDGKDLQMKSFAGSKAIGVNPNCEYPQVAVALALFLGNEESQELHYEARNIVPCNTALLAEEDIKKDELVVAQNETFDETSILQPFVTAMNNYWTPAENFGKSIVNGEVTLDNAAELTDQFSDSMNQSIVD